MAFNGQVNHNGPLTINSALYIHSALWEPIRSTLLPGEQQYV
jgi:hypothetical protein